MCVLFPILRPKRNVDESGTETTILTVIKSDVKESDWNRFDFNKKLSVRQRGLLRSGCSASVVIAFGPLAIVMFYKTQFGFHRWKNTKLKHTRINASFFVPIHNALSIVNCDNI